MNIDWNKAPEGFPLWLEGLGDNAKYSGWHRRNGEVFEHETSGQFRAFREGQFFIVHYKPVQPAWTGEGLPPVGTVCELSSQGADWGVGTIQYTTENVVVWRWNNQAEGQACACYKHEVSIRPIRTPEQIAAAERDLGIEAMAKILGVVACDDYVAATALYDAGYRKQASQ